MADIDRDRAEFEAWASDGGQWPKAIARDGTGYRLMVTQHAWTVWQAARAERASWREHVEQRIRAWRQRTMNKSGDLLAIDDFMGQDSIDDLVDFVCDEWAEPPAEAAQRVPLTDEQILAIVDAAPALSHAEDEWLYVARAIEAAHGITATEPKG